MSKRRKPVGIRELSTGRWEVYVSAGRDPVTGRYRQVSRTIRGTVSDAKKARAELLTEVERGRHRGTAATVDELFVQWLIELERKGRSAKTINNYRQTYRHNIAPTLGPTAVTKVTTKMLTDLYGAHQRRGLSARSVYQIHATISSMMTQACRWGWRDSNPAQWADPPTVTSSVPVVPTVDEVRQLIKAAENSKRPEYARLILLAATTGLRRGELCALRHGRDIDLENGALLVAHSIVEIEGQGLTEALTKNRRIRQVALDDHSLEAIATQRSSMAERAASADVDLVEQSYLFSDALDGSKPWRPGAITLYFRRLRDRVGLNHLTFHTLRKFMETYGQELGYSAVQVAIRAGHDPAVARRHYTGKVDDADRALSVAIANLVLDVV